jgi:membrane protease YdiL (CAAX protease family)
MIAVEQARRQEPTGSRDRRAGAVRARTLAGLLCAIAVVDLVANAWTPEVAQLPVKLALVAGFVLWARRRIGLSWVDLGLDPASVRRGIRYGAGAALVIGAVIVRALATPVAQSLFESSSVTGASNVEQLLTPLLIIPVGTVLFEEIIFRSVLLGALLRESSRRAAVITSAVAFGLWHILPAVHSASGASAAHALGVVVGTVAITTVAGIGFAWLRLRSGSLVAPVLAHIATNSLAFAAAVFVLH